MHFDGLVSVIVPTYNSFHTIKLTVNSILAQTYKNIEVIIIDDCSTDDGINNLRKCYKNDSRVLIKRLEYNQGVANARNAGINLSKGRYIAFCDADDLWYAEKLEKQLTLMVTEKAQIAYSSYDVISVDGDKIGERIITKTELTYNDLLYYNHIGNLTAILDSTQLGKPEQRNIRHEDYAMWLELMRSGCIAVGTLEPLAAYRRHSTNLSKNKVKSLIWHYTVLTEAENINRIRAVFLTLFGRIQLVYDRLLNR